MKKILNIFASISLISTGASSVIACGGSINNDQQIVSDITNHLKNKTFGVDENPNGTNNFGKYYESEILDQSGLNKEQKSLVTFPSSDNTKTLNVKEPTDIHVDIKSHNVSGNVDVSVKLNNDADSIADKINSKTITVYNPQPGSSGDFTTLAPISAYQSQIETQIRQLLSSKGIKSNYQLTFNNWPIDPKTHKIVDLDWINNVDVNLDVNIGTDVSRTVHIQIKLAFNPKYDQAKREIDDPNDGNRKNPFSIDTGGQTVQPKDWGVDGIDEELQTVWNFSADFEKYVTFVPTTLKYGTEYNPQKKQKEKIRNQVNMYCPLLGWTENNPRTFYVVVN